VISGVARPLESFPVVRSKADTLVVVVVDRSLARLLFRGLVRAPDSNTRVLVLDRAQGLLRQAVELLALRSLMTTLKDC